jgi:peptidylprolyl isomerase
VHYIGRLADGTVFDSSISRGQPFEFTLGVGQVIAGWDEGLATMKVGGWRKLVIPPNLGYGNVATGNIPANSTLYFDVELLAID